MKCMWCDEEGTESELRFNGHHRECLMRAVIGSAAHQLQECACYGGTREDPPGVSLREAAKLAWDTYNVLTRW
jgi:hypothetical protein